MTGRTSKSGKLEYDLDRLRAESNWPKLLDHSRQISTKTPYYEGITKFIQTECRLERYLLENPPLTSNQLTPPQTPSLEVQNILKELIELKNLDLKTDMRQETMLLLAKLYFSISQYNMALSLYDEIPLDELSLNDISSRKMKLIGEAFAIKGLCLEKQQQHSKGIHSNVDAEGNIIAHHHSSAPTTPRSTSLDPNLEDLIIECFEKSGDISLYQLQERQDKGGTKVGGVAVQGGTGAWNVLDVETMGLGPIVEHAVQKSPLLYIKRGEFQKGVGRFRDLLRVVESKATQGLRQALARQLAEVLMNGVCKSTYIPPDLPTQETQEEGLAGAVKPKKYSGDGLFVPKDDSEETILLLLISESIATREVVLNRSSELSPARSLTLHNATTVYDLLTICLARKSQFSMLADMFEKAMKFSFNEFHIWFQFALSLMCSQKYSRAYLVLKECMKLEPNNPTLYMLSAKLCYEHLHMIEEGIQHSQKVIDICSPLSSGLSGGSSVQDKSFHLNPMPMGDSQRSLTLAKGHLFLGIGHSLRAEEMKMMSERQACQKMAMEAINVSISLDPRNHLSYFHMAHQLAMIRKIPEALVNVRKALQLRRDHVQSLHLLVLLLTSQKQLEEASKFIDATLAEFPDDFSLLFTKCKLDTELGLVEPGLQTCRQMFLLWRKLFQVALSDNNDERGTGLLERITNNHKSLLQLQFYELADRESGSTRAESVAASRLEHALSEVASSMGSSMQPRPGPQQAWFLQAQIWLLLAELYIKLKKLDSAQACIQEANVLCPMSHVVSYTRGRYHEAKGELHEGRKVYENAVSINPSHVKSLLRLGIVLHKLGNDRLAEMTLRSAISCDPNSSSGWRILGQVLQSLGDSTVATDCLITSLELEQTDPILPFSIVHRACS